MERGPKDLRDLPEFFGKASGPPPGYGAFDIFRVDLSNEKPGQPLNAGLPMNSPTNDLYATYDAATGKPLWRGAEEGGNRVRR